MSYTMLVTVTEVVVVVVVMMINIAAQSRVMG